MTTYTIYGKANCVYCDRAKALLDEKGLAYEYFDIMADLVKRSEMFERVKRPVTTVPQIVLGETYVGGFTELELSLNPQPPV